MIDTLIVLMVCLFQFLWRFRFVSLGLFVLAHLNLIGLNFEVVILSEEIATVNLSQILIVESSF